jgi:2-keto-4-pentenoate hydratase/2-oxohepta-3-ene-1,7-dioic acid hydratase in catechol pathway
MKLATYSDGSVDRVGVVVDDRVHPITGVSSMVELIEGGLHDALTRGAEAVSHRGLPLSDITLRAPLRPPTMRDFVAFESHVEGVRRSIDGSAGVPDAWYEAPRFYFTNPYVVIGPNDTVVPPRETAALDFELEVAAVVGKSGSSVSVEEARDHIFGYTILNDWSARDIQRREMQVSLGPAKGKDFANTLGPWIVTADEFADHRNADGFFEVDCDVVVNGERVGHDSLVNMGWTFESLVAYASRDSWVHPGDVLGSGTVGNGGCLAELWGRRGEQSPPPLATGDVVTLAVEGIGSVSNVVGVPRDTPPVPPARRRTHADSGVTR